MDFDVHQENVSGFTPMSKETALNPDVAKFLDILNGLFDKLPTQINAIQRSPVTEVSAQVTRTRREIEDTGKRARDLGIRIAMNCIATETENDSLRDQIANLKDPERSDIISEIDDYEDGATTCSELRERVETLETEREALETERESFERERESFERERETFQYEKAVLIQSNLIIANDSNWNRNPGFRVFAANADKRKRRDSHVNDDCFHSGHQEPDDRDDDDSLERRSERMHPMPLHHNLGLARSLPHIFDEMTPSVQSYASDPEFDHRKRQKRHGVTVPNERPSDQRSQSGQPNSSGLAFEEDLHDLHVRKKARRAAPSCSTQLHTHRRVRESDDDGSESDGSEDDNFAVSSAGLSRSMLPRRHLAPMRIHSEIPAMYLVLGPGRQHEFKVLNLYALPDSLSDLRDDIKKLFGAWRTKDRKRLEVSLPDNGELTNICVRNYMLKTRNSDFTKQHHGIFACMTCTNLQKPCIIFVKGRYFVLPLCHEARLPEDTPPTNIRYWTAKDSYISKSLRRKGIEPWASNTRSLFTGARGTVEV